MSDLAVRRFYPPGEHPATRRLQDYLGALRRVRGEIEKAGLDTTDVDAAIEETETLLSTFEEGEWAAWAEHLRWLDGEDSG